MDDLILFLLDLFTTILIALDLITKSGQVSGYKLNLSKSILFPINDNACQMSFQNVPFSVSKDNCTYLGVCVTYKYRDLFDNNFKIAFNKAKQDTDRWSALLLSLAGRINSVKITIMPRFFISVSSNPRLYSQIPFKELNKCTFTLYKNVPRIRKEYLERQKEEGDLSLPNYLYYYWAANIHKLMFWVSDLKDDESPVWSLNGAAFK